MGLGKPQRGIRQSDTGISPVAHRVCGIGTSLRRDKNEECRGVRQKNLACRELAAESAAGALGNTIYANCPTVMRAKRGAIRNGALLFFYLLRKVIRDS